MDLTTLDIPQLEQARIEAVRDRHQGIQAHKAMQWSHWGGVISSGLVNIQQTIDQIDNELRRRAAEVT